MPAHITSKPSVSPHNLRRVLRRAGSFTHSGAPVEKPELLLALAAVAPQALVSLFRERGLDARRLAWSLSEWDVPAVSVPPMAPPLSPDVRRVLQAAAAASDPIAALAELLVPRQTSQRDSLARTDSTAQTLAAMALL